MGSESRGRWISVASNLGVLAGLILLVVELGQNRELMQAQVRHDLSTVVHDHDMAIALSEQLSGVIRRGDAGEELSPDEQWQFLLRNNALWRYWENVHYQNRVGLYDEVEFRSHLDAWRVYMGNSAGARSLWCTRRSVFSPEFREEVDGLLPTASRC